MPATVISGRKLSKQIREELKEKVVQLNAKYGDVPKLVVVLVGDDPASISYVTAKEKGAKYVGFDSELIRKPESISEEELLSLIDELNNDESVNGILVQLPLPKHIDVDKVIDRIALAKDVDGFHPENVGNLHVGRPALLPCTPKGIITMIKSAGLNISGMNAVIVGRSNLVGKPAAMLLMNENATVTITHSRTKDLASHTKNADILVAAIGRAKFITADMVKPGAIVIDVGVNKVDGKLCGDVDYEPISEIAGFITPVPGGVGPMTITSLLENTLEAFINQKK
ncbi:bifunctional methylenetetrahydrofolate dehydrogenase/methenyltetrahydrofolate cyclohydrolase FolD [Mycoplasmatota bacterium]|nr:bifunctional methylenetetrahydrofolate dehydrogenase/methenyltetrahydrofolate cyclohydrolase FolD [Mycoplasmatota bacterium]